MVDSNRIVSFDILKGGGILLVILGHIQIPYMLKTVIYSLALLGLHILFVDTFWIVRNKLHLVNYSWTILEFALIVAICYFATTLIKRYIPSVLGRS